MDDLDYTQKEYKTVYLGYSSDCKYVIDGVEVGNNDICLKEYCYGRDDEYAETHKLFVYQASDGKNTVRYASCELSFCIYGFWRIIE